MRCFFVGLVLFSVAFLGVPLFFKPQPVQAATHNVALSTAVQASLLMDITAGDTVAFGALTSGIPIAAPNTGTIVSVETNANNGYTVGAYDNIVGTNSALVNTDAVTRIPDIASGDITTPELWAANTGLGLTLYAADGGHKEVKWGAGTTYDDALNKYAAIPETDTTVHTVTGFHAGADTSSWAFKIDVVPSQKTGNYTGTMTFSATAVII